ncbi:hypothetical protein [Streptomyces sp. NPDC088762]|uniref:hypothetical protein n=1 Tax=Streptomyces sp. NPDC088762 TaxID=3365891 RepID=UPI00382BFD97
MTRLQRSSLLAAAISAGAVRVTTSAAHASTMTTALHDEVEAPWPGPPGATGAVTLPRSAPRTLSTAAWFRMARKRPRGGETP